LATHGTFYDAYVGLKPPLNASDGTPRMPATGDSIGIEAGGLYATLGILAAVIRALQTGRGSLVEVAEADAAAAFVSTQLESAVNNAADRDAAGGGLSGSVRYNYYRAGDGRCVLFQALEAKFWENFCNGIGRPDLLERFPSRQPADHAAGNEELRAELQRIFATRTQDEWVDFFLTQNIPGGPVHEPGTLVLDRHFEERRLMYEVQHPTLGLLKLFGTPIKVEGETFAADAAPGFGDSTDAVLREVLGVNVTEVARLRAEGAIG
jgi:crotonobetainyl-CoA:carnitine CoA-transferase CaiB-like acyl-CoA transferase